MANDAIMQSIVELASTNRECMYPTSASQSIFGNSVDRNVHPCTLVLKKWFDWAQPSRLRAVTFNSRHDSKRNLPAAFADSFTPRRCSGWPSNIRCLLVHVSSIPETRENTLAFINQLVNLETVIFIGSLSGSFPLFLVDLLTRHQIQDIRWRKDLDRLTMPGDVEREINLLYPLLTGLAAYDLLSVQILELTGRNSVFSVCVPSVWNQTLLIYSCHF